MGPEGALTVADTLEGLGACSISAQDGDVLVDAASREHEAAPGLGKLPPALLPESNSKPERKHNVKYFYLYFSLQDFRKTLIREFIYHCQ